MVDSQPIEAISALEYDLEVPDELTLLFDWEDVVTGPLGKRWSCVFASPSGIKAFGEVLGDAWKEWYSIALPWQRPRHPSTEEGHRAVP